MLTENENRLVRQIIRQKLQETVSNFIKPQKETQTREFIDSSLPEVIGDPISDVKMNQRDHELGSDGKNAPTTSVTAGAAKSGKDYTDGQRQANFSNKTEQAE